MDALLAKTGLKPEYKRLILKAIDYHLPQAKVILFGSRARSTHKPGSDIDLAIDSGEPIKLHEMSRIRVTLENLPISLEMDLVDIHNIPDELKALILKEGIVWKD
ncbi:MAG: nucleotidyltransferase domain-containing protein [Epsilonproteobacteria bacterium]|nr:nucleotidyltransferase domain-containing protein [Campylobacterota bacterium]